MAINMIRTGPRDGRTVVLVHSAGLDLTFWDAQIDALRHDHDVVAFDLPGHGRSGGTSTDMQVSRMAGQLAAVIRDLDVPRVDLVGLSVGGVIAQAFAASEPQRVRTLTLIDTGAHFGHARSAMLARAEEIRRDGLSAHVLDGLFAHWFRPATVAARPDLVDRATKALSLLDDAVHASLWEMIAGADQRDVLADITAPTMVVVGEHDSSSPVATAAEMASAIGHSELRVVAGAAHLSPLECPGDVTAILRSVIADRTCRR